VSQTEVIIKDQRGLPIPNYQLTVESLADSKLGAEFLWVQDEVQSKESFYPRYLNFHQKQVMKSDETRGLYIALRLVNHTPKVKYRLMKSITFKGPYDFTAITKEEEIYKGAAVEKIFQLTCPTAPGTYVVKAYITTEDGLMPILEFPEVHYIMK
jgi:hypothetical protein